MNKVWDEIVVWKMSNCRAIYKAGAIILRTGGVFGRRWKAIVYREYKGGDVSALMRESVEQGLDVKSVEVVRVVWCNRASEDARVNVSRNARRVVERLQIT